MFQYEVYGIRNTVFKPSPNGFFVFNAFFKNYTTVHRVCPLDSHKTVHALANGSAIVYIYCLRHIVDFIELLLFGTGCVDGSGSLSGSAFNQLKLVTLNIV